jgi:hypothetical protein
VFHEKCCNDWLDYRFKCPNCNKPIEFKPAKNRQ